MVRGFGGHDPGDGGAPSDEMTSPSGEESGLRSVRHTDGYPKASASEEERGIVKPLPAERFVDYRDGEAGPEDPTGDLGYNAEMRWEAMAGKGYLTPVGSFFVRNHAPTPTIDPASWTLRVEGTGVERSLELGYDELSGISPQVSIVRALECAGNGRAFFEEVHGRQVEGTPWRLGAVGVAEWTGVPLREVLERAGLKGSACGVMLESLDAVRMRRPLPVEKALEDDTLLAFGMNGGMLTPDHGFPLRAVVSGWAAVASVKWLGRIVVSETPLFSPWNTDKYVLTGGEFGAERPGAAVAGPAPCRQACTLRPVVVGSGCHLSGRVLGGRWSVACGAALRRERAGGVGKVELRVARGARAARDQGQGDRRGGQRSAGHSGVE